MKSELIKTAIRLYKSTLDKNSKWYTQDLAEFTANIKKSSLTRIQQAVNNMSYAASKKSDLDFDIETKRLAKAGMFEFCKMGPKNMLD